MLKGVDSGDRLSGGNLEARGGNFNNRGRRSALRGRCRLRSGNDPSQFLDLNLTCRPTRQSIQDVDRLRLFFGREALSADGLKLGLVCGVSRRQDHTCHDAFAPIRIRHTNHFGLSHDIYGKQRVDYVLGVNRNASAHNNFRPSPHEFIDTVAIARDEVTGSQPVFQHHGGGLLRLVQITGHDERATNLQLAHGSVGYGRAHESATLASQPTGRPIVPIRRPD